MSNTDERELRPPSNLIGVGDRRLGGRFRRGDWVIVHSADHEPAEGTVIETQVISGTPVEVALDDGGWCDEYDPDHLWLVSP